jgi:hypothetical protein
MISWWLFLLLLVTTLLLILRCWILNIDIEEKLILKSWYWYWRKKDKNKHKYMQCELHVSLFFHGEFSFGRCEKRIVDWFRKHSTDKRNGSMLRMLAHVRWRHVRDAALCHLCAPRLPFLITALIGSPSDSQAVKRARNAWTCKMKDHDGTSHQRKPTKLRNLADKTEAFDSLHVKNSEVRNTENS